jgi:hypothetical protein
MAARLKLRKILKMIAKMGIMTYLYPKASPKMTLVVAPILQESATSRTGLIQEQQRCHQ